MREYLLLLKDLLEKKFKCMTSISTNVYIDKLDDILINITRHYTAQLK